jgi:hypothetical protein
MPRISKAAVFMQWICNRNETPGVVPWVIQCTGHKNTGPINVSKCLVILGELYDHVDAKDLV